MKENSNIIFACFCHGYVDMYCNKIKNELYNNYKITLNYTYFDTIYNLCSHIDKTNFKQVLLTHKNTNSKLNIIFYNLHKYIMDFL